MNTAQTIDAITGLIWPILVVVLVLRLLPEIQKILGTRGFTVKAGGVEIGVQELSDQLARGDQDLREQFSALKEGLAAEGIEAAEDGAEVVATMPPPLTRVLWVDDWPKNNVYEIKALRDKKVEVDLVASTQEALSAMRRNPAYGAIISDMGRTEDGEDHRDAGLELIRKLRERGDEIPVVVYASAAQVARVGEEVNESNGQATASATELMEILKGLGLR
jgi:CheY-like chemotaxis protein